MRTVLAALALLACGNGASGAASETPAASPAPAAGASAPAASPAPAAAGASAPAAAPAAGGAEEESAMKLVSSAFEDGGTIPRRYTCEGEDLSPPLAWSGVPEGTRSLALVVEDPDAPDPANPKRTWVHWVVYDLPPTVTELAEGASTALPAGAREGTNDWGRTGYGGPCPPIGTHRYFHVLYALDTTLGDLGQPRLADLERAMEGHVLARAELVGRYRKTGGR